MLEPQKQAEPLPELDGDEVSLTAGDDNEEN